MSPVAVVTFYKNKIVLFYTYPNVPIFIIIFFVVFVHIVRFCFRPKGFFCLLFIYVFRRNECRKRHLYVIVQVINIHFYIAFDANVWYILFIL